MLNKIIKEIIEDIPRSIIAIALLATVILISVQFYRGVALVCADGSIFSKSCEKPKSPEIDLTEIENRLGGLEEKTDLLGRAQGLLTENIRRIAVTVEPTNFLIRGSNTTTRTTQPVPNSSENDICFFTEIQVSSRKDSTRLTMSLMPPDGKGRWTISLSSYNDEGDRIGGKVTCLGLPH